MKTDRELLELAAKAAGLEVVFVKNRIDKDKFFSFSRSGGDQKPWNPLDHDGDALRLAVKLRISLIHEQEYVGGPVMETIEAISEPRSGDGARICTTECLNWEGVDEMAATRRAITRAAAQIQLNKETK